MHWTRRLVGAFMVAGLGLGVGGCGDEPDENPTPDSSPPIMGEVVWEPCDVGMFEIDCALVEVPLDWDDPQGRRIHTFVRRMPTPRPPSKGQLWYLVGGPGSGAGNYVPVGSWYAEHGWDVYLMDYRGVGMSTSLDCGRLDDEPTASCQRQLSDEWGDGLRHFSTTGAALDLGALIEATRKPGEQVMIVGSSYGTFVANRYLHLFPEQADALIASGICPATGCSLHFEKNFNLAVRQLLERCAEDEFCREKIGPNPWEWTSDLVQRIDEGHCSEFYWGFGRSAITAMLAGLIRSRELLPVAVSMLHRVDRCEPEDVEALTHLTQVMWGGGAAQTSHDRTAVSQYLYANILLSEFWDDVLETEAYQEELGQLPFQLGTSRIVDWKQHWIWERYETPSHLKTWAPSSIPMLLLNGDLDYQTALWDLDGLQVAYDDPYQRFLRLPFTGHGTEHPCPWSLESSFLRDIHGTLPELCLGQMEAIDWAGSQPLAQTLMGTVDLWTNERVIALQAHEPTRAPDPTIAAAIERARAELRRLESEGVLTLPRP